MSTFQFDRIVEGDARTELASVPEGSVDLCFWSPPYGIGKKYEGPPDRAAWGSLIRTVLYECARASRPGGFVVVNIADILTHQDQEMPRFQADSVTRKHTKLTREQVRRLRETLPQATLSRLADILGCSTQTVQRRLSNSNARGTKPSVGRKVLLTGADLARWAEDAGLYLYDRRVWHKDPCWKTSRWHATSYKAVDEFEYVYMFWRPGITSYNRGRLTRAEWSEWGSRAVWNISSVRRNVRHPAEFPSLLAERVIRLLTEPRAVVLDPFCGSGTTTTAAKSLGRRWFGIEIDPDYANLAKERTDAVREGALTDTQEHS